MRILVTDPTYKHTLALVRYLRASRPDCDIVGVQEERRRFTAWAYEDHFSAVEYRALEDCLDEDNFDLVIPVSARAVRIVAAHRTSKKVVPELEVIELCLNKRKTLELAASIGVPIPRTHRVDRLEDLETTKIGFPCVVKATWEAGANIVAYPENKVQLATYAESIRQHASQEKAFPIVQEYVDGYGSGFFAFYQGGALKRWYIHRRIREIPATGGASCCARTDFDPLVFEYGKRILDRLHWNGVAMVEFRHEKSTGQPKLMEVNPKFWGSLELGLTAGINFGDLLVRCIEGEDVAQILDPNGYRRIQFIWPVDGDLEHILLTGKLWLLADYFRSGTQTNIRTNRLAVNAVKTGSLTVNVLKRLMSRSS